MHGGGWTPGVKDRRIRSSGLARAVRATLIGTAVVGGCLAAPASATYPDDTNGRIFWDKVGSPAYVESWCPGATPATFHRYYAHSPDVSPDGNTLAFRGGPGSNPDTWGIFIRNLATGEDTRISGTGGIVTNAESADDPTGKWLSLPKFSPDGEKLAVIGSWPHDSGDALYRPGVIDLETGNFTPLATRDPAVGYNGLVDNAWSPDGSKIFYTSSHLEGEGEGQHWVNRLFRVNATGGAAEIVDPTNSYSRVDTSPDGEKILATRVNSDNGPAGLWEMNYDGSAAQYIGAGGDGSYSPDGQKVAFASTNGYLATMNRDATGLVETNFPYPGNIMWSNTVLNCDGGESGEMKVNEVMVAHPGGPEVQFVELLDSADEDFPNTEGPYSIAIYNASNVRIARHDLPNGFLAGKDTSKPIMISNAAADAALGTTADHHTSLPLSLPTDAGRVCFTAQLGTEIRSCVAYGCVADSGLAKTDYAPVPPSGQSIQRQTITSSTWQIASPTPKLTNLAGTTGTNCVPDDEEACETAQDDLSDAKARLKKLKQRGASAAKIQRAKQKVADAKAAVAEACA